MMRYVIDRTKHLQIQFLGEWTEEETKPLCSLFPAYTLSNNASNVGNWLRFSCMDGYHLDGTRVYFIRHQSWQYSITAHGHVDLLSKLTDCLVMTHRMK